jgi:hypothetical protein
MAKGACCGQVTVTLVQNAPGSPEHHKKRAVRVMQLPKTSLERNVINS